MMYSPLQGQILLIVDAFLILVLLTKGLVPMKRHFWLDATFSLCWSIIVVAAGVVQLVIDAY